MQPFEICVVLSSWNTIIKGVKQRSNKGRYTELPQQSVQQAYILDQQVNFWVYESFSPCLQLLSLFSQVKQREPQSLPEEAGSPTLPTSSARCMGTLHSAGPHSLGSYRLVRDRSRRCANLLHPLRKSYEL